MEHNQLIRTSIVAAATLADVVIIGLLWLFVVSTPLLAIYPVRGGAILAGIMLCLITSTLLITPRLMRLVERAVGGASVGR